jgi:hypothetical protein
MDLLPCLAIFAPAPAATKEAVVEMLKLPELSPPVPQASVSSSPSGRGSLVALFLSEAAKPEILADFVHDPALCQQRHREFVHLGIPVGPREQAG